MARPILVVLGSILAWTVPLAGQDATGTITGRVIDATTLQPIAAVTIFLEGTQRGTIAQPDGTFVLTGVPAGSHRVRASLIGYAAAVEEVTVEAGATVRVEFALQAEALRLQEVVVTGYGTQRREAITGSIAAVEGDLANVGVLSNANEMMQGRVAGLHITTNHGEPGAGAQVRIRGGTSISASNEPLYVIDGVPINNVETEAIGIGVGGSPALPRSPLNLLNPADIESIVILKDASAAAIYGARGANGVILIETKRGAAGGVAVEYDGYVTASSRATSLDVLTGDQYRRFVQEQVNAGNLSADRLDALGQATTNWEDAITRTATTHNHNLSFAGGTDRTRYRASLNYMNQEGVILNSGFERIQGRLNATHQALDDRLRLGLNLTSSHVNHNYLPFENTGGFEGGVLVNMAFFNPTQPVRVTDPATGQEVFFELGAGRQSDRNPVAMARQVEDLAETTRTLGNVRAELDLLPGLTGQIAVGVDRSESVRRSYYPRFSPVGAEWGGRARQVQRDNSGVTLQTLVTLTRDVGRDHGLDIVGGYEYNDYSVGEFGAEGRDFLTDAFSYNNLAASAMLVQPFSWRQENRLVSFFSRVNYSFQDRFFLTGVLRRDGSSRFGADHKWATFPAVSASWRLSEEEFLRRGPFSDLRVRAGWGKQGNEAVPPYASLITLAATGGARYVFGEMPVIGVAPIGNPNPNLKWEETTQTSVALDYGFRENRITGTVEYYVKNTSDLLLTVAVPQPAPASHRLENVGSIRNTGVELSLDALLIERPGPGALNLRGGLVFAAERNRVVDLGDFLFITTGGVSGQGQSGQVSQRIMPGFALGTFFGPEFAGVNAQGQQLFNQYRVQRDERGRVISRELIGQVTADRLSGDDFVPIGNANPDFTFGLHSHGTWRRFDFSFLVRGAVGHDVFNNTALVYGHKSNVLQNRNFLSSALDAQDAIGEPAVYSSRWIEDGSFVRLQNVTVGYTLPEVLGQARRTRLYLSADNPLLLTGYSGYDPEVHTDAGLATRGIDYLSYPRPRTLTAGVRVAF